MHRNPKLLPQATLCPNDGLCHAVKEDSCSSLGYTAPTSWEQTSVKMASCPFLLAEMLHTLTLTSRTGENSE
jgi:hypothetical protein